MAVMAQGVTTYAVGTATVAANGTVVTFAGGAALQTTDPVTGVTQYAARALDQLKVGANRPVLIASVDSATQVTLAESWPFGAQTAQAYTIIRYSGVANGELAALMQQLLAMSTDASPSASVTVESGVGRIKLRIGATGKPEIAIGPNGTADASLKAALQMDPATGVVNFPFGTGLGTKPSLRNKLRNPGFQINQRLVSGTVTLADGAFGHDGVKAGAAGATYTFANVGQDVRITVTAGSIILPIGNNLIDAGSYVLSHEGAAQARVWQGQGTTGAGSYAAATRASPLIVTGLAADTRTNIEFSTGTILRPQFEPGVGVVQRRVADGRRAGLPDLPVARRQIDRTICGDGTRLRRVYRAARLGFARVVERLGMDRYSHRHDARVSRLGRGNEVVHRRRDGGVLVLQAEIHDERWLQDRGLRVRGL